MAGGTTPGATTVDAPIVAVTVHPALARVTRRGRVELEAGSTDVVVAGLPISLDEASVRVSGRGAAAARVVGVEVRHRRLVDAADAAVATAEAALEAAEQNLREVDDRDAAEAAKEELVQSVSERGGRAFAQALATGEADSARLAAVTDALGAALLDAATRRRAIAAERLVADRRVAAARDALDRLHASGRDRRDVVVAVEADAAGTLELDLDYMVAGAGWRPVYDVRVDSTEASVALTWVAMITQASGEDWPECQLIVATSQPSGAASVPELDPWWIDRWEPPLPKVSRARAELASGAAALPAAAAAHSAMEASAPLMDLDVVVAEPTDTALAAAWPLPRPVAVPGDGAPHRHVLASAPLEARFDRVTAPAQAAEAHLRASVANSTGRALLAGSASVFLDDGFVGVAAIDATAPGGELELALGVDDRITVERELQRREADKRRLSSVRATSETWTIEVTNHRDHPVDLVVRDRVPHSRHADIKVTDVKLRPEPAERDDLGRVEWRATVAAGATWKAEVGFAVEHPKDVRVAGWR
jgi:uncharacterized protein (TIGR02231 family)